MKISLFALYRVNELRHKIRLQISEHFLTEARGSSHWPGIWGPQCSRYIVSAPIPIEEDVIYLA